MLNTRRSLLISLVLHGILFIALMFVTLAYLPERPEDSLKVSFTRAGTIRTPMRRLARQDSPVLEMSRYAKFDIPTGKTARRTFSGSHARAPTGVVARTTPIGGAVSPDGANLPVTAQTTVKNTPLAARHTYIPAVIESGIPTTVEPEQFDEGLTAKAGVGGISQGAVSGGTTKRRIPVGGSVASSVSPSSSSRGIASLVSSTSDIANADSILDDTAKKVILGDEVPAIPKGEPGGIIIGRGNNIRGRLNLVRLNDPLHPSVYG